MFPRDLRALMLWLFVALQAMTPFIHAHAGSTQFNHGGWFHTHAALAPTAPAPYALPEAGETEASAVNNEHGVASRDQGAAVEVAEGLRARALRVLAGDVAGLPGAFVLLPPRSVACTGGVSSRVATTLPAPPSYARPLTLAPPLA